MVVSIDGWIDTGWMAGLKDESIARWMNVSIAGWKER